MSSLFIRKHFDLWKSFEEHCRRVFCIIHIRQYTDSWEKYSWGVGRLWALRLSLTNPHHKTPWATTSKHFRTRRVGRTTPSGVIYFIPECSLSLVFFVVSVSVVLSILSVLLARSHRTAKCSLHSLKVWMYLWKWWICAFAGWSDGQVKTSHRFLI